MHTYSHVGVTCIYYILKILAITFDFIINTVAMAPVILLVWSAMFKNHASWDLNIDFDN